MTCCSGALVFTAQYWLQFYSRVFSDRQWNLLSKQEIAQFRKGLPLFTLQNLPGLAQNRKGNRSSAGLTLSPTSLRLWFLPTSAKVPMKTKDPCHDGKEPGRRRHGFPNLRNGQEDAGSHKGLGPCVLFGSYSSCAAHGAQHACLPWSNNTNEMQQGCT